jgi:hypothetical protein
MLGIGLYSRQPKPLSRDHSSQAAARSAREAEDVDAFLDMI